MRQEDNIDDLDDPIRLYDCSNLLDAGIIEPASLEKAAERNLKYKLSLKSCYMLPMSFFDIPRNISLLNECQQRNIRVTIVDYYKHPWYFKNNMRLSTESNKTDSTIHIATDDDDNDIICLDSIGDTDKIPSYLSKRANNHTEIGLTSKDRSPNKKCAHFIEKRRKTINGKLDLELQKALSQKHSTNIDIKRNKGLVGIKITRRITVDDTAQVANGDLENNNDLKNEEGNKKYTKINDTETYVNAVDKKLERVGTVITPILEENVTSTVNNNQLETKPPSDNYNKSNIKCQMTIPQKILENVLKLNRAAEAQVNKEQKTLNKSTHNLKDNEDKCRTLYNKVHIVGSKLNNDLKTSEKSSAVNPNKYEKKFTCRDEIKYIRNNDRPKQRPMPKCKKLLENLRIKNSEVKEKSVERKDDKIKREISGIISPILPGGNKKIIEKVYKNSKKTAFKLNNVESTQIQSIAIRKECYKVAQKLIQSITNHEISPQLERNETTDRKQNFQMLTEKVNSNKQVLLEKLDRPTTNSALKSNSTVNLSNSRENMAKIVSVEDVKENSNINNNLKTVKAQQNTQSDTRPINSAVKKAESIVLQKPIRTKTLHQDTAQQNMQSDTHSIISAVKQTESIVLQRPIRTKTPHQDNTAYEIISNRDTNPGNNIPSKIPVINNQASAIILRPQLKKIHVFNTSGQQPIQTCRSQYPKVTKYPTLDKLLLKTNFQPIYQVPRMQPSQHFLPTNQNGYQHQNCVHPPPYYGGAHNMMPVRPVLSNNFGAPNPNPYWNYGYPSTIPPPPPPPPVQNNYNPNILTDIQPNDVSSIIGRNVNGLVKKINIINSSTPPLQPEHDTKEGIVKLEPVSPQNTSESIGSSSSSVFKTVINSKDKPVGTKSEMLEELEKSMLERSPERTDLKRPNLENSVVNSHTQLPTLVHKVGPLSKKMKPNLPTQSTKQTVTVPRKGYSPPILPIPTYQNFLSQVNSNVQNYVVQKPKDVRNPVTPCIRHASSMNLNYRKATKRLDYDKKIPIGEKPAKKISIADYKKRSSPDTNCAVFAHKQK